MATRYATGTGVWDAITSWGETSGGINASVPIDGDDVIFDTNSGTITLDRDERCDNITFSGGGVLDTDSTGNFTLTADLRVYFSSGGVMNCNTSDIHIGSGLFSNIYALQCTNGTFNGGDGEHWIGCIKVHSGGVCNLTSGITHIDGEESTSSAGVLLATGGATTNLIHNSGTVSFETNRSTQIILQYVDITLYNVIINLGTTTQRLSQWANGSITTLTIAGDFTVTKGKFDTKYASVQECTIDVTGTTTIGDASATGVDYATLITNESAIVLQGTNGGSPGLEMLAGGTFNGVSNANHTMGSVLAAATTYNSKIYFTSGTTTVDEEATGNMVFVVYSPADVNFYHGNGTVEITTPTYAYMYCYDPFYNLIINHTGTGGNIIALSNGVPLAVDNDLIFTDGDFTTNLQSMTVGGNCEMNNVGDTVDVRGCRGFTVAGDCLLASGATFIAGENPVYAGYYTRNTTFKSLTISGSWTATPPNPANYATYITGRSDSFGHTNSWRNVGGGSTFISNSGAVYFNGSGDMVINNIDAKGKFYNLYVNNSSGDVAIGSGVDTTVDNDIIVYDTAGNHDLRWGSSDTVSVGRNLKIVSGTLCNQTAHTGILNVSGNLELTTSDAKFGGNASNDLTVNLYGNLINNGGEIV
jgi:hypothetical protein